MALTASARGLKPVNRALPGVGPGLARPCIGRLRAPPAASAAVDQAESSGSSSASSGVGGSYDPSGAVGSAWDPEGLLPSATSSGTGGHFSRRQRQRDAAAAAAAAAQSASASPYHAEAHLTWGQQPLVPAPAAAAGAPAPGLGLLVADLPAAEREWLAERLAERYMTVDLGHPGLRVHHLEPPVFTVDQFMAPEQCAELVPLAQATGKLQRSKVGSGYVTDDGGPVALNTRRTSTSALLDPLLLLRHPQLRDKVQDLHSRIWRLLAAGHGEGWGVDGQLPQPGQFCYEAVQVAHYSQGQYFLAHEDAFPAAIAAVNGFQRRATLLVYLNDVPEGGATMFEHLGVSVQPRAGQALLFFPGLSNGDPDPRTLHTAQDAVQDKWVTQQWIACGLGAKQQQRVAVPDRTVEAMGQGKAPSQAQGAPGDRVVLPSRGKARRGSKTGGGGFGRK